MSCTLRERLSRLSLGVAIASSVFASLPVNAEPASITLDEAIRRALTAGPDIPIAAQRIAVAQGALTGAQVFPTNPAVRIGGGGRYGFADGLGVDGSASVNQAIPIFGRWGAAERAAQSSVEVAHADLWAAQTRVAQTVALSFFEAQRAQALVDIANKRVALVRAIVDTAERKLEAGDGTILDVNLWLAELGRAEASLARLEANVVTARTSLALVCGIDPASAPAPSGRLGDGLVLSAVVDDRGRADLFAQSQRLQAAEAQTTWQERKAWPDVTLSASAGTEGAWWRGGPAGEVIGGTGVSVPFPLFQRNQGGIAKAKAATSVAQASLARAQQMAKAEAVAATAELDALVRAERALKSRVLDKQEASLALLKKAHKAGTLGVTDILLRQRSLLEAEALYVNALADVNTARVRRDVATGALSAYVTVVSKSHNEQGAR